jgi:hypothetical protein
MTSIPEWRKWIIRLMTARGVNEYINYQDIVKIAAGYYDVNLERALTLLVDDGITICYESQGEVKYILDHRHLDLAKIEMNSDTISSSQSGVIQPFIPDPKGYVFRFEIPDRGALRKQCTYHIFTKIGDQQNYAAQIITRSNGQVKTLYLGSLNNQNSIIFRLWNAIIDIVSESKNGEFILQDLQNKEPKACGNNRQRGKVALAIFSALEFISIRTTTKRSIRYCFGTKKPIGLTLDDFTVITPNESVDSINDPEIYNNEEYNDDINDAEIINDNNH